MFRFFRMIADLWQAVIKVFDEHPLVFEGDTFTYEVSLFALVFAFLVIGFVISYFWKGART